MDEAIENDNESQNNEQEPPREKFYCEICGKYYDKTFEQVHVQMHSGEEKFNCHICNKVFPNDESLTMHMNAHQDTRVVSGDIFLRLFGFFSYTFFLYVKLKKKHSRGNANISLNLMKFNFFFSF